MPAHQRNHTESRITLRQGHSGCADFRTDGTPQKALAQSWGGRGGSRAGERSGVVRAQRGDTSSERKAAKADGPRWAAAVCELGPGKEGGREDNPSWGPAGGG